VRGPVGSLARPESADRFEAFDAGNGVTVFAERALLEDAGSGTIPFQFGLHGRCTAVVDEAPDTTDADGA
jgi:hypothetical protein